MYWILKTTLLVVFLLHSFLTSFMASSRRPKLAILICRPLAGVPLSEFTDLLLAGIFGSRRTAKNSNGALSCKVIFNSTDPESGSYFLPFSSITRNAYSQIHALTSHAHPQQTPDIDESPRWEYAE